MQTLPQFDYSALIPGKVLKQFTTGEKAVNVSNTIQMNIRTNYKTIEQAQTIPLRSAVIHKINRDILIPTLNYLNTPKRAIPIFNTVSLFMHVAVIHHCYKSSLCKKIHLLQKEKRYMKIFSCIDQFFQFMNYISMNY